MSEIPGLTPIPYDSDPWTAGHMKDHELVAAHLGLPAPVVGTWGHIAGHTKIAARLGVDVPGDTNQEVGVSHRCGLFDGHDGDHRDWGVLETPGEVTSWTMTWSTEVMGG